MRSSRARRWLGLGLLVAGAAPASGCYTFCDGSQTFAAAEAGDLDAIYELGEWADPRVPSSKGAVKRVEEAYALLSGLLAAEDPAVRATAFESARRLVRRSRPIYRDKFPALLDPFLVDPDPWFQWRTAWTLGDLELTRPALRALVADPDVRVARWAAWALGRARDDQATMALVGALDRSIEVAEAAAAALDRIHGTNLGDPAAWRERAAESGLVPRKTGPR